MIGTLTVVLYAGVMVAVIVGIVLVCGLLPEILRPPVAAVEVRAGMRAWMLLRMSGR